MQKPSRKVILPSCQEDVSQKVVGSNPASSKLFSCIKLLYKGEMSNESIAEYVCIRTVHQIQVMTFCKRDFCSKNRLKTQSHSLKIT